MKDGDVLQIKVKAKDKSGDSYSYRIGAGFVKEFPGGDLGISLKLNPGVVLDWRMNETHWINLNKAPKSDKRIYENEPEREGDIPF